MKKHLKEVGLYRLKKFSEVAEMQRAIVTQLLGNYFDLDTVTSTETEIEDLYVVW